MHPCRSVQRIRCLQARKARSSRSVLDRTSCDTGKRLAHRLWATVTGDRCTPAGSGATAGHHVCLPVPLRRRRPDARLSSSRPGCTRPQQCQQSTSSHSCFHSCTRGPVTTSSNIEITVASRYFQYTGSRRLGEHQHHIAHHQKHHHPLGQLPVGLGSSNKMPCHTATNQLHTKTPHCLWCPPRLRRFAVPCHTNKRSLSAPPLPSPSDLMPGVAMSTTAFMPFRFFAQVPSFPVSPLCFSHSLRQCSCLQWMKPYLSFCPL